MGEKQTTMNGLLICALFAVAAAGAYAECPDNTRCATPRECAAASGEAVARCGDGNVCCGRGTEPSVCREGTRCVSPRQCAAAGGEAVSRCGDGNVAVAAVLSQVCVV